MALALLRGLRALLIRSSDRSVRSSTHTAVMRAPGDNVTLGIGEAQDNALLVAIVAEHEALRKTIDNFWSREIALIAGLFSLSGGAVLVAAQIKTPCDVALLFLISSFGTSAVAWGVEMQYWTIIWYQGYIVQVLRRHLLSLLEDSHISPAILGFELYARSRENKPFAMIYIIPVGLIFYQIMILGPSIGFLVASVAVRNTEGLSWNGYHWALFGADVFVIAFLAVAVGSGYWAWYQVGKGEPKPGAGT